MAAHQDVVDEQDEQIVGQDAQGRPCIEIEGFGTADAVAVALKIVDERLADEKSADDEKDVDTMRHRHIGETVERCVEEDAFSVTLNHAENGKSAQKIQAEDTLTVYLDAEKVPHLMTLATKVLPSA